MMASQVAPDNLPTRGGGVLWRLLIRPPEVAGTRGGGDPRWRSGGEGPTDHTEDSDEK